MPNHILTNDIIEEMLDNISTVKLNTYIKLIGKEFDNESRSSLTSDDQDSTNSLDNINNK